MACMGPCPVLSHPAWLPARPPACPPFFHAVYSTVCLSSALLIVLVSTQSNPLPLRLRLRLTYPCPCPPCPRPSRPRPIPMSMSLSSHVPRAPLPLSTSKYGTGCNVLDVVFVVTVQVSQSVSCPVSCPVTRPVTPGVLPCAGWLGSFL